MNSMTCDGKSLLMGAMIMLSPAETIPVNSGADHVHILHRDYETRSQAILKTVGTYRYACDPSTSVLCAAFAIDDEPMQLWTPGDPVPTVFRLAAQNPNWIVAAHNDVFETV